jgi:hypothetical protein
MAPKPIAIHHLDGKAQMLAHLRFLTRSVVGTGPEAQALAVYAEPSGTGFHHVPAAGLDYEGVACVDDAARAVVLLQALAQLPICLDRADDYAFAQFPRKHATR